MGVTRGSKTVVGPSPVFRASGALTVSMERWSNCILLLQAALGRLLTLLYKNVNAQDSC